MNEWELLRERGATIPALTLAHGHLLTYHETQLEHLSCELIGLSQNDQGRLPNKHLNVRVRRASACVLCQRRQRVFARPKTDQELASMMMQHHFMH